jgi:uncharacterized repeat protein (TIGR03803 family)
MANDLGRVPLTPEMNSFQAEIGGNQRLLTSGNFEDGAIISDADSYALPSGSPSADGRDQQFFGERHDELNIQGAEAWAENLAGQTKCQSRTAGAASMWTLTGMRDNMTNRWGVLFPARQSWKLSTRLFRAMTHNKYCPGLNYVSLLVAVALTLAVPASAEWKEKVLYSFQGGTSDGSVPAGGVVFDPQGNLFGATTDGGPASCKPIGSACGTVFQLSPPAQKGGSWTETLIYQFQGKGSDDASVPNGGLIRDTAGNLYGVTAYGGTGDCVLLSVPAGCGAVYEISPPKQKGGAWTETILYSFPTTKQGYFPNGNLVFDSAGNLYGATSFGGTKGTTCDKFYGGQCGTVFKLSPPKTKGGKWTEEVLHSFASGTDGANPNGGLVLDGAGNVYGTTFAGGTPGWGTVFKLNPPKQKGGAWAEKQIHVFSVLSDGASPSAGVVFGKNGMLYGTTYAGGTRGNGVVFDLAPPKGGRGPWRESVLHRFTDGNDGSSPRASLVFDGVGNLYGTTNLATSQSARGNIFRLKPPGQKEGGWVFSVIYTFKASPDGEFPASSLVFDKADNMYGTTQEGGAGTACDFGCGAVFGVSP